MEISKSRCIYAYEFSDNHAYIGLTYNLANRKNRHKKNGTIYNYIKNTNLKPIIKQLTDYIPVSDAKIKEGEYVCQYIKNGWLILNKAKTGSIGSNIIIWTKEKCQEVVIKCKTKTEFYKKFGSAASSALKNGWMDEICLHMENKTKPKGYWTYEKCLEEAIKQGTRTKYGYWTIDKCNEEAKKYLTRGEFQKQSNTSFNVASRHNWLDIICTHMKNKKNSPNYWTKDRCHEEAKKYLTRGEFQKQSKTTYVISAKNGWLNEICSHMIKK